MTEADQTAAENSVPENGEELVDELATIVNRSMCRPEEIVGAVGSTHRFLQQRLFDRVVKPLIIGIAIQGTDRRNEQAVQDCEKIVDAMDWNPSLYESDDDRRR